MKKAVLFTSFMLFLLPLALTVGQDTATITLGDQIDGTLKKEEKQHYVLNLQESDLPVDVVMYSDADSVLSTYDAAGKRTHLANIIGEFGGEVITIKPGDTIPVQIEVSFYSRNTDGDYSLSVLPSDTLVSEDPQPGAQVKRWATLEVDAAGNTKSVTLPYLLYVPEDYDASKSYPFILFMHGAGEAGPRLDLLYRQVIPKLIEGGQDFPFIIASPHLDYNEDWQRKTDVLASFVADLQTEFPIDPNRIYVTGLSLGGQGAWSFALDYPDLPAAVVSMAGFYFYGSDFVPKNICDLAKIPMWVFHGGKDDVVALEWEQALADGVKDCGGDVKFTLYPDADHAETFETGFADPALYTWLLEQHK